MKIASIRLKNFKRFTDLAIRNIPETAKLVVVVGPNGCGKSSLFDAFLQWYRAKASFGGGAEEIYYRKNSEEPYHVIQAVTVDLHDNAQPQKGSLYVRTAYRNDPDFSISGFTRQDVPSNNLSVNRVIENDQTVSQNYQRLVFDTMNAVYDSANDTKTVETLRDELIGRVRDSMRRVFDDLLLNSIAAPSDNGAFFFQKGTATSFHYKNLSGGEKAAFDLLLDIHLKREYFKDAIYCIDEVEAHLHTRVQGILLKELVDILPDASQLWVTTHSLGVLRAAQKMAAGDPASVCIIEFDGVDPDVPCELIPSSLGRLTWEKMLSITLDDLSQQIAPTLVVVCEGSSIGNRRKDFDAEIYNRILGAQYPIVFVSGGSSNQIEAMGVSIGRLLSQILPATQVWSLGDRDDKSDAEIAERKVRQSITLSLRNLESYLFADDVIAALVKREKKDPELANALRIKEQAILNSIARGNPPDDLKSAAGEIYNGLKALLGLQRCGNTTDAFMRDTLAPLIEQSMPTFDKLKEDVIDNLPNVN